MNQKNDSSSPKNDQALVRHSAVSWIEQAKSQGHGFKEALLMASQLAWDGRLYSPRTLEGWYYLLHHRGFEGLEPKKRRDQGQCRALSPETQQVVLQERQKFPQLNVTALLGHLEKQGVLEAGTYKKASVYRLLRRQGLDRQSLKLTAGAVGGPTKAFEMAYANALWMVDMMHGPILCRTDRANGKTITTPTYLFGFIDDCSRLVPHAQYYSEQKLRCLMDTLREACSRRGIPDKLYTDNGKVFRSKHFRLVCANLNIRLLHAKPYASYSKGKIERFFQTAQTQFEASLLPDPVEDLDTLNQRFWRWLETDYHQRKHSSLQGQSPSERFTAKLLNLRRLPNKADDLFFTWITRRVRLDATVTIEGQLFEVPVHLKGHQVQLRYDPFTFGLIEVWHGQIQAGLARPLDKQINGNTYRRRDYERRQDDEGTNQGDKTN
jgi:transposase InsO family protein